MKELELFYLEECPYCVSARRAVEELRAEKEAYAALPIRWIEESEQPGLAEARDYYYVPSVFLDGRKLYEARPGQSHEAIRNALRRAFDEALRAE